ncbi:hypothetical protein OG785_05485 [Streptomyces sp. NBC_00006]|uniref:hypothetical protein n=1 Tax=unclassified Streptomyces TaxID=2593676 RepID=UPI00225878AD|nr:MULTISPECIES: hypothetical protein [unclassified Streptomyces]MCX4830684.1 hypothetical protein [Streptomyces sp. NBC_01016]MCX5530008.1 hypothetical protein [Streptomyces sp. NBC_00006]
MSLVPWDAHVKIGQLAAFFAALATAWITSARRRRPRAAPDPPEPPPPPTPAPLPAHVVPCRPAPATEAVTDLCTCVSELASDLAKRYADDGRRPPDPDAHT